jgi:hypothetical protein
MNEREERMGSTDDPSVLARQSTGIALCGKWGRAGFGGKAPIIAPVDAAPSPDDCAVCRRKLEAMVCGNG